jgi:hypothetical protein
MLGNGCRWFGAADAACFRLGVGEEGMPRFNELEAIPERLLRLRIPSLLIDSLHQSLSLPLPPLVRLFVVCVCARPLGGVCVCACGFLPTVTEQRHCTRPCREVPVVVQRNILFQQAVGDGGDDERVGVLSLGVRESR